MWELHETSEFEHKFEELPPNIKERFENQIKKLQENPYVLGKRLVTRGSENSGMINGVFTTLSTISWS